MAHDPDSTPDWSTLDAYLAGALSDTERAVVERWHADVPADAAAFERVRRAVRIGGLAREADAAREFLARVKEARARRETMETVRFHSRGMRSDKTGLSRGIVWSIGAALCIGAVAVVGSRQLHLPSSAATQRYQTSAGQQATIRLADGSSMRLAPATTATVTPNGIAVSGEAYFSVTPHQTRVFRVTMPDVVIQVLGTQFSIRHYPTDRTSHVAVENGKVRLQLHAPASNIDSSIVVTAKTAVVVTDSGAIVQPGSAVDDYTAWTRGRLVFRKEPLRRVIEDLSRAYGTEIRLSDTTLATAEITAAATVADDPLPALLDDLMLTIRAHYRRDGAAFVIVPGPSAPTPQVKRVLHSEKMYGR